MKGMRPLTDKEVKLITDTFSGKYEKRDRALFLLGVKSGLRIQELLSLRIRDVYSCGILSDRIYVQRRNTKKQLEGRSVVLNSEAKKALESWLEELWSIGYMESESYVFQSRKGENRPISKVQAWRILNSAAEANDLPGRIGTHCMRKTFADRVYDRLGHDLFRTQAAMGHKNINSTISYLSFRQEDIDDAILSL